MGDAVRRASLARALGVTTVVADHQRSLLLGGVGPWERDGATPQKRVVDRGRHRRSPTGRR